MKASGVICSYFSLWTGSHGQFVPWTWCFTVLKQRWCSTLRYMKSLEGIVLPLNLTSKYSNILKKTGTPRGFAQRNLVLQISSRSSMFFSESPDDCHRSRPARWSRTVETLDRVSNNWFAIPQKATDLYPTYNWCWMVWYILHMLNDVIIFN